MCVSLNKKKSKKRERENETKRRGNTEESSSPCAEHRAGEPLKREWSLRVRDELRATSLLATSH